MRTWSMIPNCSGKCWPHQPLQPSPYCLLNPRAPIAFSGPAQRAGEIFRYRKLLSGIASRFEKGDPEDQGSGLPVRRAILFVGPAIPSASPPCGIGGEDSGGLMEATTRNCFPRKGLVVAALVHRDDERHQTSRDDAHYVAGYSNPLFESLFLCQAVDTL